MRINVSKYMSIKCIYTYVYTVNTYIHTVSMGVYVGVCLNTYCMWMFSWWANVEESTCIRLLGVMFQTNDGHSYIPLSSSTKKSKNTNPPNSTNQLQPPLEEPRPFHWFLHRAAESRPPCRGQAVRRLPGAAVAGTTNPGDRRWWLRTQRELAEAVMKSWIISVHQIDTTMYIYIYICLYLFTCISIYRYKWIPLHFLTCYGHI